MIAAQLLAMEWSFFYRAASSGDTE